VIIFIHSPRDHIIQYVAVFVKWLTLKPTCFPCAKAIFQGCTIIYIYTGEVDMKKTIYSLLAWATLILGVIFIIMPIIPGLPLVVLSASLFAMV